MDVYNQIDFDDLTDDLQMMSNACGIETVQSLLRNFGGMSFYIPKLSRLDSFVWKYVKKNSDKTFKQIARELKVSEQFLKTVRNKMHN